MNNCTLQEIIDYFTNKDGYDPDELVRDWVAEIPEFQGYYPDDYMVTDMDDDVIMNLEDFSRLFYEKVITGVCNVLETFKAKE